MKIFTREYSVRACLAIAVCAVICHGGTMMAQERSFRNNPELDYEFRPLGRSGLALTARLHTALRHNDSATIVGALAEMITSLEHADTVFQPAPLDAAWTEYLYSSAMPLGGIAQSRDDGALGNEILQAREFRLEILRGVREHLYAAGRIGNDDKAAIYAAYVAFAANPLTPRYWFLDCFYAPSAHFMAKLKSVLALHDIAGNDDDNAYPTIDDLEYCDGPCVDLGFQVYVVPLPVVTRLARQLERSRRLLRGSDAAECGLLLNMLRTCVREGTKLVIRMEN